MYSAQKGLRNCIAFPVISNTCKYFPKACSEEGSKDRPVYDGKDPVAAGQLWRFDRGTGALSPVAAGATAIAAITWRLPNFFDSAFGLPSRLYVLRELSPWLSMIGLFEGVHKVCFEKKGGAEAKAKKV